MNQTPAAILILTSSLLAYTATINQFDPTGVIIGLAALVLGIWGVISLIGASIRDRELSFDSHMRRDLLGLFDPRRIARPTYAAPVGTPVGQVPAGQVPTATLDRSELPLSPEIKAQLSMASHLEGRDRAQIVEEALRRYLPSYEAGKDA